MSVQKLVSQQEPAYTAAGFCSRTRKTPTTYLPRADLILTR